MLEQPPSYSRMFWRIVGQIFKGRDVLKPLIRWKRAEFRSFVPVLCAVGKLMRGKVSRIFEWGPGTSTRLMTRLFPEARILSVEHLGEYYRFAREAFTGNENVEIVWVKKKGRWGGDEGYVTYPLRRKERYDLVFVDGRSRCDCLFVAKLVLNDGGIVVLHDSGRASYRPGKEQFEHVWEFGDYRTCVLSPTVPVEELMPRLVAPLRMDPLVRKVLAPVRRNA